MSTFSIDENLSAGKAYALGECDYCGIRFALVMLDDNPVCHECAKSRVHRIKACAERMARHREDEPEDVTPNVVDVFDEELL